MKICFIGTVEFSARIFEYLLDNDAELVGLITSETNSINSDYTDLVPVATKYHIPILKTNNVNSADTLQWLRDIEPDVIFCFGWSRLLKGEILALPKIGVIGYHPAELPMNRGRHPLIWALALGLSHTASTFFFMDEGADSGDILSQVPVPISYNDDARSLYDRMVDTAMKQIKSFLINLEEGSFCRISQNHELATVWRKRGELDGKIDFRMPARAVYNLVRALTHPYVGAHLGYDENEIKIWKIKEVPNSQINIESGKVIFRDDKVIQVKCGIDSVEINTCFFDKIPAIGEYL